MGVSIIFISPSVLFVIIDIILNVDDFPAPLGPNNPKTSPFLMEKVFLLTAATPSL